MNTVRAWGLLLVACLGVPRAAHADETVYDVVIYGGSSSAVVAAVQVSRMGRTVAIVCPDTRLGGLSASGLGCPSTQ